MEAKESLVKAVKALQEIGSPIVRTTFVDFVVGRETNEIIEANLHELESFGIGDSHDEEYWNTLIDAALKQEYLRIKSIKRGTLEYTSKGKTFARKPVSFLLDEEDTEEDIAPENGLEELVSRAMVEKKQPAHEISSAKTKLQIKLIHAIDRKMALDDFAEIESVAFDDILDELEMLQAQGRNLSISYFTDEVIGENDMKELLDFFASDGDDLDHAMVEYGDVFNIQEIRLARIVWRAGR
ncbi:MAG: hypothetical protein HUK03_04690 [Bacteroidaceae bacterium]|nr:hypothetical protein [Bacteroidaceae bacterium]